MSKKLKNKKLIVMISEEQMRHLTDILLLRRTDKNNMTRNHLPLNLEQISKEIMKRK